MHYNMFIPAASSAYSPMEWDCGDALFCSEVLEVELGHPSKTHALMIQSFILLYADEELWLCFFIIV